MKTVGLLLCVMFFISCGKGPIEKVTQSPLAKRMVEEERLARDVDGDGIKDIRDEFPSLTNDLINQSEVSGKPKLNFIKSDGQIVSRLPLNIEKLSIVHDKVVDLLLHFDGKIERELGEALIRQLDNNTVSATVEFELAVKEGGDCNIDLFGVLKRESETVILGSEHCDHTSKSLIKRKISLLHAQMLARGELSIAVNINRPNVTKRTFQYILISNEKKLKVSSSLSAEKGGEIKRLLSEFYKERPYNAHAISDEIILFTSTDYIPLEKMVIAHHVVPLDDGFDFEKIVRNDGTKIIYRLYKNVSERKMVGNNYTLLCQAPFAMTLETSVLVKEVSAWEKNGEASLTKAELADLGILTNVDFYELFDHQFGELSIRSMTEKFQDYRVVGAVTEPISEILNSLQCSGVDLSQSKVPFKRFKYFIEYWAFELE